MAIMAITAKNAHMTIMAMGDGNINAIQHSNSETYWRSLDH